MMRLILFTLFSCCFFISASAQKVIPLEVSKNGHLMVQASINGVSGRFIFDTGAGLHVISNKFFQKIKNSAADSSRFTGFRHTGERLDGPMYRFSNLTLEGLRQDNPWVGVYPGFDDQGFDGLISCKLIENEIITMDIKNKQIIVETKESLLGRKGKSIPILLHKDRDHILDFFIPLRLNDQYTAFMEFDTGSGYSPVLLHSRYMDYAKLDTTQMEVSQSSTGFGAHEKTYFDKSKKLKVTIPGTSEGGYPNIVFKPSLIYDGLCSHIILGDQNWSIDLRNRMMYVWD